MKHQIGWAVVLSMGAMTSIQTATLHAESSRMPDTYSFLSTNSMVGPGMTVKVNRNGSKELIERIVDRGTGGSNSYHDRVLYDFEARRIYTVDLNSKLCTTQEYGSAYAPSQLDPIGGAAETQAQLAANPPKAFAAETLNGIRVKVADLGSPQMQGKLWLDEKFSFMVKLMVGPKGAPPTTAFEMRELRYEPSPASLFTAPTGCTQVAGISTATGGHAEFQADAQVHVEHSVGRGASGAKRAPARRGPDPVLGKWEFTGTDGTGAAWTGFLTIREIDLSGYGENPPPYSHQCEFDLRSANSSQGMDSPCLYDEATRKLSAGSEPPNQYTAVLSADGASFVEGRWGEGEPAKGSWSAKSTKSRQ